MRRLLVVLVCFLFTTVGAWAQQVLADSLVGVLNATENNAARVDVLCELSSVSYNYDIELGYSYAQQAYAKARHLNYKKGMRYALILQGFYQQDVGDNATALKYYREASALYDSPDDLQAYGYVMTGNLYRIKGLYDSAAIFYGRGMAVLDNIKSDTYRAYTYKSMARLYMAQWKNKEAEECLVKALDLYKKKNNNRSVADTELLLARLYRNKTDYAKADVYIAQACQVANALKDDYLQFQCLAITGEVRADNGDYTQALELYFRALKMLASKNIPTFTVNLYYNIGSVYEERGQNDLALKYFLEALKIAEKLGNKHELARIQSSVAWIYKNQLSFSLAHDYVNKSLAIREEIGDDHGISNCYNVMGLMYLLEKKYTRAQDYMLKSLAIRKRIDHKTGISACLFNLGLISEARQDFSSAMRYQEEALAIDERIGNRYSLGVSYNSIGNLYIRVGRLADAKHYLEKARDVGMEIQSETLKMYNKLFWSKYLEAKGDFKNALVYHQQYSQLNDSIYSENNAGRLAELEALYQVEKKDEAIVMLNQQRELQKNRIDIQQAQINLQNTVILFGIAGIILISVLSINIYRYNRQMRKANIAIVEQKEEIQAQSEELTEANQRLVRLNEELIEKTEEIQAQSEELRETNEMIVEINRDLDEMVSKRTAQLNEAYKELDTFFYRSSHDFRRPLTTFMGLAEVASVTVKDHNALELFDKVRETARSLDKMLIKLQSISDVGAQQLVYKEVFIEEIYQNICDDFREDILAKGIKTYCEVSLREPFISYPAMVRIILENMIENAINFSTPLNPFIRLQAHQENDECVLILEDNGQGILKEYHERVFEMYFRASDRSKGNGLGLYIVRKAVEKLNGSISLAADIDEGSRFIIRLPISYHESVLTSRFKV